MVKKKRYIFEAPRLPPLRDNPIDSLADDMAVVLQAVRRRLLVMRDEVIEAETTNHEAEDDGTARAKDNRD
jgi:hypothetical protein